MSLLNFVTEQTPLQHLCRVRSRFGFTGGSHFAVLDQTDALRAAGADRIVGSMAELADAARGVPVSLRA